MAEDAPRLAARLKLSKAEQAVLALGADEALTQDLPDEDAGKRLLYRSGADIYASQVLLAWAACGAASDDVAWQHTLTLPQHWEIPVFPLRGPDIMALGDFKGPEIGEKLRAVEQYWIDGGFTDDRAELLAKAKSLAS